MLGAATLEKVSVPAMESTMVLDSSLASRPS